ncbi:hypothetical protein ABZX77_08270 [Streptomyces sp. NPDC004237]|uniref:hypothetical protein n=1 Tax=Streptomyces sp. NPDC004237 TaxID=3154455 RepID=UPI0033B0A0A8
MAADRRAGGRVGGRIPRPLVCALAVVCVPPAVYSAAPWPAVERGGRASTGVSPAPADDAPGDRPPARAAKGSWVLRADRLRLRGARFRGVVTVRTAGGTVRAVKLTVRSLEAVDLDLTAGRGRAAIRVRTGSTTSTFKGAGTRGVVTLYLRRLSGTVTGLGGRPLPADRTVTVTPDAVPDWLARPTAAPRTITLTTATATQAAQFGAHLSVKGARLRAATD